MMRQRAEIAAELVKLKVDVVVTWGTASTIAAKQATSVIPVVTAAMGAPLGTGIVASLARPGGNTTGFLLYEDSIAGKWLGMLKEIEPHLTRAALVGNPKGFPFGYFLRIAEAIGPSLGIEIVPAPIANVEDLNRSIDSFARVSNGGLLAPPDNTIEEHRDLVIALAARHRLPAVYSSREFVVAGGLMSYSTDVLTHFRQAASYVDRVLRGANPANLPVETPTKYETVLNLKTAKALGFEVSPTLLVRADEVIE